VSLFTGNKKYESEPSVITFAKPPDSVLPPSHLTTMTTTIIEVHYGPFFSLSGWFLLCFYVWFFQFFTVEVEFNSSATTSSVATCAND
jgi:hypothetical protein